MRTIGIIVVALAIGGPPVAAQSSIEPGADEGLGDAAAAAGDWQGAVAAYRAAVERSAADIASWYKLGVAHGIEGDANAAAEAFRRVRDLDPAFPEIDARIAAAEGRARYDAEQALDRAGFFNDSETRSEARRDALESGRRVLAVRASLELVPGADPEGDALAAGIDGDQEAAAEAAAQAVAAMPAELSTYLLASEAYRLAGQTQSARYYADLYVELGGDPADVSRLRDAIDRASGGGR